MDINDWSKVKGSARPLKWWSAWTPADLTAFESATIAGAGYFHSIGYKATQAWFSDKVRFVPEEVTAPERARPHVLIHYFTRHRGSTDFWKKDEGLARLLAVLDHLKQVPDLGYWATNTKIHPYFVGARLSGEMVSPRQEGTNALMHHETCAFIYSSKAVPADGPSLEVFGLKKEDVERAREIEDLIQFVLRGALRRSDFDGEYKVYLYDRHQAEALASYLEQEGIAMAELIAVEEAGIMDEMREKLGRKRIDLDESSKAERDDRRREADKARKARDRAADREEKSKAGTLRGRGRPKKQTGTSMRSRRFRSELTSAAKKNRYGWKEDLCAIREREAAEAKRKKTQSHGWQGRLRQRYGLLDPLHGSRSGSCLTGRLPDASTGQEHRLDGLNTVICHRWATQPLLASNPIQSGHNSGTDYGSFELAEHAEKLEQHPAGWGARVDGLLMQVEIDPTRLHVRQEGDEILQRPAQTIHAPCSNEIELFAGDPLQQAVEARTLVPALRAGNAFVSVDGHDRPAETDRDLVQLAQLVLDRLVLVRAHTSIKGNTLRHPRSDS